MYAFTVISLCGAIYQLLLFAFVQAIGGGHSDESGGHEGHGHNGQVQTQDVGHDHHVAVWKGMVVLGGIYFFFLAERAMGMVTSWKRNRRKSVRIIFYYWYMYICYPCVLGAP